MNHVVAEPRSPRFIGRQLALGFGVVSLVSTAMCILLVLVTQQVAGVVASMRHDEMSIRQGMELSQAVREMSLHIAHTMIEGDASHVEHYLEWRGRVRTRIQTLAARLPDEERSELEALGEKTQAMHELFIGSAVPAAQRSDRQAMRRIHGELERLGTEAAQKADSLASVTTRQMAHAHDDATHLTRLGLIGGGICALLIVVLSVAFTIRLRSVVLRPLDRLTGAALRYGRGDFAFRLGDVGRGELAAVADAFSHMADELARREARIVHQERMAAIGQLAAGIAHELNNPIGIIRGFLKTMSPDEGPETLREELAILDEEAGHCQRLADDLLAYARVGDLVIETLSMEPFLRETARRYETGAGGVDIDLDVEDVDVEGDMARLKQVMLNLLNNAFQASPAGSPIRIRGRAALRMYQVEVVDHGPGVSPADKQRIFEPFFSTKRGGSGLGLAVCQGIIQAHGGTIIVEDAPDGGSVFRVAVPLTQATAAVSPPDGGTQEERT